jgi:hypothetical protein
MSNLKLPSADSDREIPDTISRELRGHLPADERLIAWVQPDLDEKLHFGVGLVAVTDRRLIARAPGATSWSDCVI